MTVPDGGCKKWTKAKKSEVPRQAASGLANFSQSPRRSPRNSHSSNNEAPIAAGIIQPASVPMLGTLLLGTYAPDISKIAPIVHNTPPAMTHPAAIWTNIDGQETRRTATPTAPVPDRIRRIRRNKNGNNTSPEITSARLKYRSKRARWQAFPNHSASAFKSPAAETAPSHFPA